MNQSRIASVIDRVAQAAGRCGRDPSAITLVAAVKGRSVQDLSHLLQAGITNFGENKAQELIMHYDSIAGDTGEKPGAGPAMANIMWHFIGHLQTNKINQVVPHITLLHSLDRIELAEALDQKLKVMGKTLAVLVEVNSAKEEQKWGVMPDTLPEFLRLLKKFTSLTVKGLMTMGRQTDNLQESRQYFNRAKTLFDQNKSASSADFDTLSMGMSNDFELAIEEGATMVRIGTALFS